jgi:hypothetical protein
MKTNRLGKMGLKWDETPPMIGTKLEKLISLQIHSVDDANFYSFLHGSVEMGYHWNERNRNAFIFPRLKSLYHDKNIVNIGEAGRVLSAIVYTLGESTATGHCNILEDEDLQRAIFYGIEGCFALQDAFSISNIIYG